MRSFGKFWKSFRMDSLLSQLSYALPLGLAGLLWALQVDVDNYFVSHYFSAALFAIYSTGCFDVPLVGILGDSVGTVLIPRISSLQATGSISEIVSVVTKAMRGLALVYAPVYVFTSLAATQVITLLFRKEYLASVPIFRINLLMVLLGIVSVDPIIRAFKSERFWVLRMNIVLLAVLCGLLFLGIKQFGLIGAVSSVIIIQYVARALIVWRVSRLLGVHWKDIGRLKDVGKTIVAAAAAGLCVFPLLEPAARWGAFASLAFCGTIFTAIYGLLLVLLKVPTEDEIVWFWARVKELLKTRLLAFIPGR
jgi:O-antigen/teichoic acid export membrane protein